MKEKKGRKPLSKGSTSKVFREEVFAPKYKVKKRKETIP